MAEEYVGDEALGTQIQVFLSDAQAIAFRLDSLSGGLLNEGHGYAQEYASWHSEELLEKAARDAAELARHLNGILQYTRVGANRR